MTDPEKIARKIREVYCEFPHDHSKPCEMEKDIIAALLQYGSENFIDAQLQAHEIYQGDIKQADAEGYRRGVEECMAISDGQAPIDYPADKISGCKYYVTEKMLALINPSISKTVDEWEKQFKQRGHEDGK